MKTNISSLGQGPGLAWKRGSSSFPPGSLAELQDWMGGATEPVEPPWHGEVTFQRWNTVGWAITDDGILCIKPWEGSTGETGPVTSYKGVPWYDIRWMINKVESTSTIVLNEDSAGLFYDCSSLYDLTALADWNVSNVTRMDSMFSYCPSLDVLDALAEWDVSNVTNMRYMFSSCSSLHDLNALMYWNVSEVTNMGSMFYDCSSLRHLDGLRYWEVSEVTNMGSMFAGCSTIDNLHGLKDWEVSQVTNMSSMFYGCSGLTDLNALRYWNVSEVTNTNGMFAGCSNLTDLKGLEDWNVSNVTNMSGMFYSCSNLTDLSALAYWNVSSVTSMSSMFQGCSSLQRIGIPSIANGGQKLVENADDAKLTTVLPSIISEDGSMGPYTWDDLNTEMTTNPDAFEYETVWVKA